MPVTIPCPNPICEQKFAAETIQGTGKLACPRCGTVFQFRPATQVPPVSVTPTRPAPVPVPVAIPTQKPAPVPVAQPVRKVPVPTPPVPTPPVPTPPVPTGSPVVPRVPPPMQPQIPMATPVPVQPRVPSAVPPVPSADGGDEDDVDEDDEEFERVRRHNPKLAFGEDDEDTAEARRRRRSRNAWLSWLWKGPLLLTAVSTTVVLTVLLINYLRDPELNSDEATAKLENAYFPLPERPWARTQDDVARARQVRGRMKVNFVTCRSKHANAVALFSRDYDRRMPTENELLDTGLQKLRSFFTNIEWEQKDDGTLAGKKAMRVEFVGVDGDQVISNGEFFAMAHHGVGYWFFSWGPESQRDLVAPEWESLRKKFTLGTRREGWVPTPPKSETITVPDTRFQIRYPDDSWEVRTEAGWDSSARLVLAAYEREGARKSLTDPRQRYSAKMAVCQVMYLPKADSLEAGVTAAKAYLLDRVKKESPNALLQTAKDKKGNDAEGPADVGGVRGFVTRQELTSDAAGKRYFLLAVVADKDGVLVLEFECGLDRKEYWEGEFTPVWQSLRATKPAG